MNQHTLKHGFLGLVAAVGLAFLIISPAYSATYYVRVDGGTTTQCTGLTDAPYPGSGTNRDCAFSHPFWAIAPIGNNPTKMAGGDTLIIDGSNGAQYKIGLGAPNTGDTSKCSSSWPWDCVMRKIPSGPDPTNPTRILGKGWNTGCSNPSQLWGTERAAQILDLRGSNNVELQCLDITDHSACQKGGPNPCNQNSYPYGPWASIGIEAADSANVLIKNVSVHGLAHKGIHAGRLRDWILEDTKITANSFVGWDGDIGANVSSNSGTMIFNRVTIAYNGCGETYPGKLPYNCYSQDQGGYGDGLGTHKTGANWVFNNSDISHNVSDGLDLLYHDGTGTVTIKRSRFEGNAGNQVKTSTNTTIENSLIIGNCAYFKDNPITWQSSTFNNCRAFGNSIALSFRAGMSATISGSTIITNGDNLILTMGGGCNGTEVLESRNNIFLGGPDYTGGDTSDLYYASGLTGNGDGTCGTLKLNDDYSVIYRTKTISTNCVGKIHSKCQDPKFVEPLVSYYTGNAYNVNLQSTSPAIGIGLILTGKSSLDYNSNERGTVWDIGAIEYGIAQTQPTCVDGIQYCTTQTDCTSNGHYWYNNTCNAQPKPLTCADGIQYCTTQTDCTNNGYYWYNNTCNTQPQPKTCADGIQYCTTQTACEGQSYYWYNNTCNAQPKPLTCADGIQYCLTQTDCTANGHYWYNNTCNAQPKPLTCVDGIQYCTTQTDCTSNGHYWYNNTCNAQPKPLTCADGIQYCTTQTDCTNNGYYWYNNTCNTQPQPKTCADGIQYCTTQTACEGQSYYWYNNTCNAQPKPLTCADGIQYCLTQTDCTANGHYWYNNTCNAQPQPAPTCADGAQYCKNKPQCTNQGYFWYNNTCNTQPQPKTCADGIQYCTTQTACEGQSYFWYNNTCNAQPKPLTCADGIQYCSTKSECEGQGYYWYTNSCNLTPKTQPTPQSQPKQDSLSLTPTTLTSEPDSSLALPTTTESISDNSPTVDISPKTSDAKIAPVDPSSSQPVSLTSSSGGESQNTGTGGSGKSAPLGGTGAGGGGTGRNPGKSSGGSGGTGTSSIGAGGGTGGPTNIFEASPSARSIGGAKKSSSNLTKGSPQTTASQPTAINKSDSALITPSLPLTDNTSISLNRNDIAAQAEVASEPTAEPDENQPDESVNSTKPESETPLDKTIVWVNDFWRRMLRWFLGD